MIDFDFNECNSIKSIAIKRNTVDITSRFIKGKMFMFAKVLLKNFIYDMIDIFCFPTLAVRNIYDGDDILKCHMYLTCTCTCNMYL